MKFDSSDIELIAKILLPFDRDIENRAIRKVALIEFRREDSESPFHVLMYLLNQVKEIEKNEPLYKFAYTEYRSIGFGNLTVLMTFKYIENEASKIIKGATKPDVKNTSSRPAR